VTFGRSGNKDPKKYFVFTRDELEEVATLKGRHGLAAHETTNPCLLIYAPTSKKYKHYVKQWRIKAFKIERRLCKHPEEFRNAWDKIPTN
jgi:predicted deacetylase